MSSHNQAEEYNPKQRIVGGLVLVLLVMLLYIILKAILGISSTGPAYALRAPLPDEVMQKTSSPGIDEPPKNTAKFPIISSFVFLDINGEVLKEGMSASQYVPLNDDQISFEATGEERWFIQVASLKDGEAAQELAKKLANNGYSAIVIKSGHWNAVRLEPRSNRAEVLGELKRLRREASKFGLRSRDPVMKAIK